MGFGEIHGNSLEVCNSKVTKKSKLSTYKSYLRYIKLKAQSAVVYVVLYIKNHRIFYQPQNHKHHFFQGGITMIHT